MNRLLKVSGLAVVLVVTLAAAAFALEQTNGTGKTSNDNSIGYNVKCTEDLAQTLPDLGKFSCPKGDVAGHLTFEANGDVTYVDPVYGTLQDIKCGNDNDPSQSGIESLFKTYVFKDIGGDGEEPFRTRTTASCVGKFTDASGNTVYAQVWIKVYFHDRGEPGTQDRILFYATTNPDFKRNAELDPNALVVDASGKPKGTIQNGNVQIHTEVDPTSGATQLNTDLLVPVSS